MKFIVFLLSLSDIRSLSQEKRDVNTFFIFFQYFFHFSLFFCTIINETPSVSWEISCFLLFETSLSQYFSTFFVFENSIFRTTVS